MHASRRGPAALIFGLVLGATSPVAAEAADLPIFDTHLHYSQNSWSAYTPEAVLAILDGAGVKRAFVSSTPDDGTMRLYDAAPARIVPVLRPYRQSGDRDTWHGDATLPAYLENRLRRGIYRGIGEFHLFGAEARSPVVREVVALAARGRLFLHCHCDVEALVILLGLDADVPILWAHAGMSEGPAVVDGLLARYPRLVVELALRSDVAPGGRLDPGWRALFLRHPDRFMLGTDTWVASRWGDLPEVQGWARAWLGHLPEDVAGRIASGNAERLARGGP